MSANLNNVNKLGLREVTADEQRSLEGGFGILETIITEVVVDTVKGAFTRSLYDDVRSMIDKK